MLRPGLVAPHRPKRSDPDLWSLSMSVTDDDQPSKLVQWLMVGLFVAAILGVVVKFIQDFQSS